MGLVALRLQILSQQERTAKKRKAVIELLLHVTEIMCKETIIYFDKILFASYRLQTIMILEGEGASRRGGGLETLQYRQMRQGQ